MSSSLPPITDLPPLSLPNLNEDSSEESEEETFVTSSRMLDNQASFFATFIDGSSLRYLIEYLRNFSLEGTFLFKQNCILYQKEDDDETILNDVILKTYKLTDYEFSSNNEEIPATINLSELRNKTRTVGKKEQMDIYRRPEEPSNFYIQVRSQEKSSGDNPVLYCMHMKSESVEIYELPEYARGKHNPNCTIYQSDFSKLCKALVANKCTYADFLGYEKGILIKGYGSDGRIIMVKEYGKCQKNSTSRSSSTKSIDMSDRNIIKPKIAPPKLSVRDAGEIERFRIYNTNIKALAKMNGFSANGTIRFYIEKDAPMKLVCNIGLFGKLTTLIRTSS